MRDPLGKSYQTLIESNIKCHKTWNNENLSNPQLPSLNTYHDLESPSAHDIIYMKRLNYEQQLG